MSLVIFGCVGWTCLRFAVKGLDSWVTVLLALSFIPFVGLYAFARFAARPYLWTTASVAVAALGALVLLVRGGGGMGVMLLWFMGLGVITALILLPAAMAFLLARFPIPAKGYAVLLLGIFAVWTIPFFQSFGNELASPYFRKLLVRAPARTLFLALRECVTLNQYPRSSVNPWTFIEPALPALQREDVIALAIAAPTPDDLGPIGQMLRFPGRYSDKYDRHTSVFDTDYLEELASELIEQLFKARDVGSKRRILALIASTKYPFCTETSLIHTETARRGLREELSRSQDPEYVKELRRLLEEQDR